MCACCASRRNIGKQREGVVAVSDGVMHSVELFEFDLNLLKFRVNLRHFKKVERRAVTNQENAVANMENFSTFTDEVVKSEGRAII